MRIIKEVFQKSLNSKVSDFHAKDLKTQVAVVVGTRKCECDFHQKIRNQYVERKMGIKFRIFGEGEGKRSAPKGKQFTYDKCIPSEVIQQQDFTAKLVIFFANRA